MYKVRRTFFSLSFPFFFLFYALPRPPSFLPFQSARLTSGRQGDRLKTRGGKAGKSESLSFRVQREMDDREIRKKNKN
jgi:hypothetical protein